MSSRTEKTALFEAIALMGKGFASPRRLELLDLLAQGARTVEQLARASEQSSANTSQHLQALHTAGMVTRAREGTSVRYALAGDEVLRLWLALRDASFARLGEVERAARDYLGDDVEAIGRDELRARLRKGDVVLVDVRPHKEYEAGHIRGARSIPIDELEGRLAELPDDQELVATGRGLAGMASHRQALATDASRVMGAFEWMRGNLSTQGYCLSDADRRELAIGLRFSTGVCLTLVIVALVLQSAVLVFALTGIGIIASFAARHPFDHLWNHGVRRLISGPVLPPNPPRRRDAFKVATVWLAIVGTLLSAGAAPVALVLGGLLVAACAVVTTTNLCLPSELFAWWERRHAPTQPITD